MPISWNEIRHNAVAFAKEWAGVTRENAERQTFWNEFFAVFGIKRRTVPSFEEPVKNLSGNWDYIDSSIKLSTLPWPSLFRIHLLHRVQSKLRRIQSDGIGPIWETEVRQTHYR